MDEASAEWVRGVAWVLVVGYGLGQWALEALNRRHLHAGAGRIPERLREVWDEGARERMVCYQSARSRFAQWRILHGTGVTLVMLFSGILPWGFGWMTSAWGDSAWVQGGFLLMVLLASAAVAWPLDYYDTFVLEQRFGFNTTTRRTWWLDRARILGVAAVLGWPLAAGVIQVTRWAPGWWWLLGWALVFGFQLLMVVLAPRFILPLFNRFTPLPEGALKERLLELARRTSFAIGRILVMDGSQRSRHANAYFTGFGRARRVVLYDTLTGELAEPEIESVVAHEIGHAKLGHIPKMILLSGLGLLVGFLGVYALSRAGWFPAAFGFQSAAPAMTLLLCLLLSGPVLFWVEPLLNGLSRAREFEADAYAARWGQGGEPLVEALIKLNESNLSQWMPHPLYRWFYYSHPTLAERIEALEGGSGS